jgi:hypothetical protein
MSKRHQASRRRAYGRRQHEVHEREVRRPESADAGDGWGARSEDAFGRLDLDFASRFRFAVPD